MTEEEWRKVLMGIAPGLYRRRRLHRLIPAGPRCKFCNAPFGGIGAVLMQFSGRRPYSKNPHFCEHCLVGSEISGVEIEISMLFADVRGSTTLAERMKPAEYSLLLNRFYATAVEVLIRKEALIDKFLGDEVVGLFLPGFSGSEYSRLAVQAAQELLHAVKHSDADEPWLPIGIGVHTGIAYVGLAGVEGGICDLTAIGDAMNTTARLAAQAGVGEILVSEATCAAIDMDLQNLEVRHLDLKGKNEPVDVRVLHRAAG